MAAGSTFSQIYTTTTASDSATVTFSSIPNTYSDLFLSCKIKPVNNGTAYLNVRVNSDSGSNYSNQQLVFTNANASAYQVFNDTGIEIVGNQFQTNGTFNMTIDLNGYSSTSAWHPLMLKVDNTDSTSRKMLAIWKSTSAIDSITIFVSPTNSSIGAGSTFSLYGILRA